MLPLRRAVSFAEDHPLAAASLLFLAQLIVRGLGLGRDALWLDESLALLRSSLPAPEILRQASTDQNPPLYFLLLSPWMEFFGATEIGARSFSLVASALSGSVLFLLARRFFSAEAAILVSGLYLGSGMALHYAQEARSYSLVLLLCVSSYSVYLALLDRPTVGRAALLAFLNAAAVYTHFTVAFAFLGQLVGIGVLGPPRRTIALYLGSQLAAVAAFLPWLPNLFGVVPTAGSFWLGPPVPGDLLEVFLQFAGGPVALATEVLVVAVGLVAWIRSGPGAVGASRVLVIGLWGVGSILVCFAVAHLTPIFLPRYVLFALPGLLLFVALQLGWAIRRMEVRWALALALAVSSFAHAERSAIPKPDWREIAAVVREVRPDGSPVFVSPPSGCSTFGYYFDRTSFTGPTELTRGLRAKRVYCFNSVPDLTKPRWRSPRSVVVVLKLNSPVDVAALSRDRGYLVSSETAVDGVRVIVLETGS